MSPKHQGSSSAEAALVEAMSKIRFPEGPSLIVYIPPEVLEEIFQICAASPLTRGERPNRLAISQVCRQWREITLSNPWIWGRIEVGSPKMAKELISRSDGAFLDIVCARDTRMIKVRGTDLQPHSTRIRSFDISFRREYELGNLFSRIGDDFPNLSSVSLDHIDYLYRSTRVGDDPVVSKAPFSPRIERLELRGVSVDWVPKLTDMTMLELRGVGYKCSPTATLLRQLLLSSPRLEHLSLDKVHTHDLEKVCSLPPVALPKLRVLYLEEKESVIYGILPLLCIPSSALVILDFVTSRLTPQDLENTRIVTQRDNVKFLRPDLETYTSPGSARLRVENGLNPSSYLGGLSTTLDLTLFTTLEINKAILSFLPMPFLLDFLNRFSFHTLQIGPNKQAPSPYAAPMVIAPGNNSRPTSTPAGGEDATLDPDGSKSVLAIAEASHRGLIGPFQRLELHIPIDAGILDKIKAIIPHVVTPGSL
ncbi:hypothetical protein C0992_009678 [Termitomyces sp. T32_za158]|nr:hypothetical protein C0992_009678 [Termitomyces sp. T32_za158]